MMFDAKERSNSSAARLGMALFRISQAIKKLTQLDSEEWGLSPVQIQALLFIHHTRGDVATVGHLANSIGTTHVTAVKLLNGLLDKGLVVKSKHEQDKRITTLQLTEQGIHLVEQLSRWGGKLQEALERLSDSELDQLETGLGGVVHSLQQEGLLVVAEPCMGCIHFQPHAGTGSEPHYCGMIQKYLSHEATLKECPEHTKGRQL